MRPFTPMKMTQAASYQHARYSTATNDTWLQRMVALIYLATMTSEITRKYPRCIATISAGFEKGDFLVREEKGQRVYFDFFEEAFNYIAAKGYSRMSKGEEGEWGWS